VSGSPTIRFCAIRLSNFPARVASWHDAQYSRNHIRYLPRQNRPRWVEMNILRPRSPPLTPWQSVPAPPRIPAAKWTPP
jgi:hypothetical protein